MLHKNELTGSDLPILNEKEQGTFTYDELVNLGENPADYEPVGFIRTDDMSDEFYEKVYSKN